MAQDVFSAVFDLGPLVVYVDVSRSVHDNDIVVLAFRHFLGRLVFSSI